MKSNAVLTILLILICLCFVFYLQGEYSKKLSKKIEAQKEQLVRLDSIIKIQEAVHNTENAYRKGIHRKDSLAITKLKRLKLKDSLTHITTIKKLISKYSNDTNIELEKKVVVAYNQSVKDSLPPISFSESNLTDTTIQKIEKSWSLALYNQNIELKSVIITKDSITISCIEIIRLKETTINSYSRDIEAFNKEVKALQSKDIINTSIIEEQKQQIKSTKTQRNIVLGASIIVIIGLLIP